MSKLGLEGELGLWEGSHRRVLAGKDTRRQVYKGEPGRREAERAGAPGHGGGVSMMRAEPRGRGARKGAEGAWPDWCDVTTGVLRGV